MINRLSVRDVLLEGVTIKVREDGGRRAKEVHIVIEDKRNG